MGMHVFSYLKQTLKRKDKSRDADWDFGARQSSPVDATASTRRDSRAATSTSASASGSRRRRSVSLDDPRQPYSPLAYQQQHEQQQACQQRRVSVALTSGSGSDVNGPHGHDRGHAQCQPDNRVNTGGPRSGSPEDDVLLAAGETAKGVRTAVNPSEKRRRAHSMAPVAGPSGRPTLRHATSALTTRNDVPTPASPSRPNAGSPTPSVQSFHSVQVGPSDASRRAALLASKRSMPQLHNVWENFLEEVAEDVDSFSFPMPPQSQSPGKYATVHANSKTNGTSSGNQHSRHQHHTPTSSSSSTSTTTTTVSVGTIRTLPRNHAPGSLPQSPSPKRSRGHMRASHQTSSSTSSATTSTQGSTSSMAAFSSASSMTTAPDECDDNSHLCDDPVPPTPRSSAPMSPKSFKFTADPSLSSPITQRLRKSPTSPALQHQRGVSPTSSTSSEYVSSPASGSHSQSTTPTPSSACPTPSPTPCSIASPTSPAKYVGRLSPVDSRASGQYRRTPEIELPEQPLSPGSTKGRKPLSNSYRYSAAGGSQVELRLFSAHADDVQEEGIDEDVLSELEYHKSSSLRGKTQQQQRQSIQSATFSPSSSASSSPTPSGSPVVPPLRRSSRQHLRTVVTHSIDSLSLPRAKSASNIRHGALQRPPLIGSDFSPPFPATKERGTAAAASSGAPVYLHEARLPSRPLNHARSQTLQHGQPVVIDANNNMSASPKSSRPGQGRLRSGSASLVYNHSLPQAKAPPSRPPPAPPLDMNPTRLQPPTTTGRGSASASPLTPASAVHWGYAL